MNTNHQLVEDDMPFTPSFTTICWHCKAPIDDWSCLEAGWDEGTWLGYECLKCGKHLGHRDNPGNHTDFELTNQLMTSIYP